MNWKDVPIPRRMKPLQRDKRGYPILYTVLRDSDGVPHFAVNDSTRVARCVREKRCAICGSRLDREMWMTGGPLSAFHPYGSYRDPALHHECMQYAMQVCPYLAMPKYLGRIYDAGLDPAKIPDRMSFFDSTMIPERPVLFVSVCTLGIGDETPEGPISTIKVRRPYVAVEFWQNGTMLPFDIGAEVAHRVVNEYRAREILR